MLLLKALLPPNLPAGHFRRAVLPAMILDMLNILAAYGIAFLVRTSSSLLANDEAFPGAPTFMIFVLLLTIGLMYLAGVYHRIWSSTSGQGISVLLRPLLVSTIIILVADLVLPQRPLPLSVVLIGNLLALVGMIGWRYHTLLTQNFRWFVWFAGEDAAEQVALERLLIVGAGLSGQDLAIGLRRQERHLNLEVVGFVDDDAAKQGLYVENRPVLGTCKDIPEIVEAYRIDLIAVAIHNISGKDFRRILEACESTPARIRVVPDVHGAMRNTMSTELLRPIQPEDLIGRSVITTHEAVDLSPIRDKVILVTGAAGSIGSEVSRQLPAHMPRQLILLDKDESGLHDLTIALKDRHPKLDIVHTLVDITDEMTLHDVFERFRPEIVFHAAAYKHVPLMEMYPNAAVRNNIGGTRNLAFLARTFGVQRFVLVSTDKAVNPSSVMGASKRICEMIVRTLAQTPGHATLYTSVRFGNVLGSRGSVVPTFTWQINQGGPVTVTDPHMTRYFMSIPEAANLIIHAACLTQGGDTFLLRMGEEVRIVELAERMIRLRGMRPYQDIEIRFTGMRPGEKLHEQLYDGSAETARSTAHPGIVSLETAAEYAQTEDSDAFLKWVDRIVAEGIGKTDPLRELLYGLTPNEAYAITELTTNKPS